jgi:peptidoglycan/xylan/chitin deacetylase (PgdA/CDA1 family)
MSGGLRRTLASRLCAMVPPGAWLKLLGVQLVLPRYHLVDEAEPIHVRGLHIFRSTRQFAADMDYFQLHFQPVSLQQVIDHLDGGRSLPRRCFLPSFDDGFREVHDVIAPALLARGIPAVFFLNTSVIDNADLLGEQKKCLLVHAAGSAASADTLAEAARLLSCPGGAAGVQSAIRKVGYGNRQVLDQLGRVLDMDFAAYLASKRPYLSQTQVKKLAGQGFEFGAHSDDHPWYSELSVEAQLEHTKASLDYFAGHALCSCRSFAFPYSDRGVTSSFFERMFGETSVRASFGSDGLKRHFHPRNLERFKMDYPDYAAAEITSREFLLALLQRTARRQ